MNADHLESLLLDRELGELPPAVAELLEAHLAHDPAAARRATELRATLGLARRAVAAPATQPPRALDLGQLRRVEHATQTAARRTEYFRLAACLALGLGLGWFLRPAPAPTRQVATLPQPAAFASDSPAEPRSTFWSVTRLAAGRLPPSTPDHPLRSSLR